MFLYQVIRHLHSALYKALELGVAQKKDHKLDLIHTLFFLRRINGSTFSVILVLPIRLMFANIFYLFISFSFLRLFSIKLNDYHLIVKHISFLILPSPLPVCRCLFFICRYYSFVFKVLITKHTSNNFSTYQRI